MRTAVAAIFCLALSGCYVKVAGNQSTSGGTTTTTTSGQVGGSATFLGGQRLVLVRRPAGFAQGARRLRVK